MLTLFAPSTRLAFDGCCPDCKMPGDDCPIGDPCLLAATTCMLAQPPRQGHIMHFRMRRTLVCKYHQPVRVLDCLGLSSCLRSSLASPHITCTAPPSLPLKPSACTVWGECSHSFHMHCIVKWINSQGTNGQRCPMCRRDWQFKSS